MTPRITIVTPSFNQAKYVQQTMDSVLNQNYSNLEYIVIDGGSTDGSQDIIEGFRDRLAYYVSEKDQGQSHAINKGFARSTGEVMGWLNSDDLLLPGSLSLIGEIFSRWPQIQWIAGWNSRGDVQGRIAQVRPVTPRLRPFIRAGWYHHCGLGFIQQDAVFWRRSLWERADAQVREDLHGAMDFELWQRFARYEPLVTLEAPLSMLRQVPGQKSEDLAWVLSEVGIRPRRWQRVFSQPLRILFTLAAWPITPRVCYSWKMHDWQFRPGIFFPCE